MLRRQASTKINLTLRQTGPRPAPRCRRCGAGGARPREVPRAACAQSAVLLHTGFILEPILVCGFCSLLSTVLKKQENEVPKRCPKWKYRKIRSFRERWLFAKNALFAKAEEMLQMCVKYIIFATAEESLEKSVKHMYFPSEKRKNGIFRVEKHRKRRRLSTS